jgi:hypothetical protein
MESRLRMLPYTAGNIIIALLLIGLLVMTRKNVPKASCSILPLLTAVQIYTAYSTMAGLFSTVSVGLLILLILSGITITIMFWSETSEPGTAESLQADTPEQLPEAALAGREESIHSLPLTVLIGAEGLAYMVVNIKLLQKWVRIC